MDFILVVLALLISKEVFWFVLGLLVGWNVLPQPTWIKSLVERAVAKVWKRG